MSLIKLICANKLEEAKSIIVNKLNSIVESRLLEAKQYIAFDLEESLNVVHMGRTNRIRQRIRRDSTGNMVIQRNRRKSAIKGYAVRGGHVKRMSTYSNFRRSQKMRRAWKSVRRAKLNRSLLKRKMSMRKRYSLGIN